MKKNKLVYFDILCAIIYSVLGMIFYKTKAFCIINFIGFLFVGIFDCIFYIRKQYFTIWFTNIILVVTSISYITVQTIESTLNLILISCSISLIIVIIIFGKIKTPRMSSFFIAVVLIATVILGQIQNIDKSFVEESKIYVDLSVKDKLISGKFGLYQYTIETSEYKGSTLILNVNKSVYESINEGDWIRIEIQEGLLGYQYFALHDYGS